MFILGILGILQACFLPGLLVLFYFFPYLTNATKILLSFPVSLTINYIVVTFLVCLGLYQQAILIGIFFYEIIFLFLLFYSQRKILNTKTINIYEIFVKTNQVEKLLIGIALIAAIHALWKTFFYWLHGWGGGFYEWDAVASWNPWAESWADGKIPYGAFHYPQILPISYSITYVFMHTNNIHFFAKALCGFFPIFGLLYFIHLALLFPQYAGIYLFSAWWYEHLFKRVGWVMAGYADIPVSFMAIAVLYCLVILFHNKYKKHRTSLLYLGAFIAAGAATTKQAGLYIAYLFPVFVIIQHYSMQDKIKKYWLHIIFAFFVISMIALPWYIKEIDLSRIFKISAVAPVTNIVTGTPTEKFIHGLSLFQQKMGNTTKLSLFLLLIILSLASQMRFITLFITVPFFCVWAIFFSYDIRNFALNLGPLALSLSSGFFFLVSLCTKKLKKTSWKRNLSLQSIRLPNFAFSGLCLSILVLLIICNNIYSPQVLAQKQKQLNRSFGHVELNNLLYDIYEKEGFHGKIISTYYYLGYLPEIQSYAKYHETGDLIKLNCNDQNYAKQIYPKDIAYILFTPDCLSEQNNNIKKFLLNEEALGKLKRRFSVTYDGEEHIFFEIVKKT